MNEERSLRFTDSYLTSTISTTSGLGSNYTTNTSGSSNTQNTPSPRRKTSSNSFVDVAELPEQESENPGSFYNPAVGNYSDYRLPNQPSHYFNRISNYGDDNFGAQRQYGYSGE